MLSARYLLRVTLFLAAMLLANMTAMAAGPVLLPNTEFDDSITSYVSVFEDPTNELAISDLLDPGIQRRFRPSHSTTLRFGETQATYWVRFSIDNSYPSSRSVIVALGNNRFSHITLYNISTLGQYLTIFPSRDFPLPKGHFLQAHPYILELPAKTTSSYLMKIESAGLLNSDLRLISMDRYSANEEWYSAVQNLIAGWLFATAAYFLHIALSRRLQLAGYAAFYCFCGAFFGITWLGQLALFDGKPFDLQQVILLSVTGMLISRALFCYHLSWIGSSANRSRQWILASLIVSLGLLATAMLTHFGCIESTIPAVILLSELSLLIVSLTSESRNKTSLNLVTTSTLLGITVTSMMLMTNFNLMEQDSFSFWAALILPTGISTFLVITMMLLLDQPITGLRSTSRGLTTNSRLLDKISHELTTPTSNVIWANDLLLDTPLTDNQRDYLETLQLSAIELRQVTSELSDLAKIQDEHLYLSKAPFDVIEAALPTVSHFRKRAKQRQVELLLDHEDDFSTRVMGDEVRFRTLLHNLLRSLLEHLDEGSLSIHMANTSLGGLEGVCIQIRMTGRISQRDKLQSFTDALLDKTTSEKRSFDVSWNLLILQQLLNFMQVAVEIESMNNRLVSLTLYAPLETSPQQEQRAHHHDDSLVGTSVLILDDNAQLRHVLEKQVRRWGMRPQSTHNAKEALAMLRNQCGLEHPYETMIVDQDMSSIGGLELAHKIQDDAEINPKPRLVMLTSSNASREQPSASLVGIQQLVEKPVSSEHLKIAMMALKSRSTPDSSDSDEQSSENQTDQTAAKSQTASRTDD